MSFTRLVMLLPLLALAACNATIGERMGQSLTVLRGFEASDHPIPSEVFANAKGVAWPACCLTACSSCGSWPKTLSR